MTEHNRNRQQWKALRAPVIQRAWANRADIMEAAAYALRTGQINIKSVYHAARRGRLRHSSGRYSDRHPFGDSLILLTTMRAAERAGENALMWKLSRP